VADIRKQLGLDFLRETERKEVLSPNSSRSAQSFLEDAVLAYGRPILDKLRQAAPGTLRLFSVIDDLQIPIEVALKTTDYLAERNFLTVVSRDLKGNHELALAEAGRKLLS
jgi:hypothetical protein